MTYSRNARRRNIAAQLAQGNVIAGREARGLHLRAQAAARYRHLEVLRQREIDKALEAARAESADLEASLKPEQEATP